MADTKILNGQIVQPSSNFGVPATSATQCLQDSFRIPGLPLICGENSGEHGMNDWPSNLQITTLIIEYFVEKCNTFQFNQSEFNCKSATLRSSTILLVNNDFLCQIGIRR